MKVLMICTEKLPVPAIRGGAIQTYICGIMQPLSQFHQLTILGRSDPELPGDEFTNGIRFVRIDSKGHFDYYLKGVEEFLRSNQTHYDIVHIFNRPRMVRVIRELFPSARIFLSMHNDMFTPDKIDSEEGASAVSQAERIVTVSDYIGNNIVHLFPDAVSKVKTVYSGVNLNLFVPWTTSDSTRRIRETLKTTHQLEHKKVILFVGRISPKKGAHVLVKAMRHIRHPDAALVLVGSSWYSDNTVTDYVAYVRALAVRSPIPVVTTGYVPSDLIHQWYLAADLFVCSSLWEEPLARVHYEAMAAGLPILTTARGGNPEIILNENGLIVEHPEDSAEFAQKLNWLLDNAHIRSHMGMNGRHLAEQKFAWQRVVEEILQIWS